MKQKIDWIEKRQSQRRKAEGMLSRLTPEAKTSEPAEVILHELLVHKVELEMQVEELRRAHETMEEARDRYVDLYDFAPVGYVMLNREGLIGEVNLTGAILLGVDRAELINRRFSTFVAPKDRDVWHRFFMSMMGQAEDEIHTMVIEMVRADASLFHVYLDCQRRQPTLDAPLNLRVTLFDLDKIKQAEAEYKNATTGLHGLNE